MAPGEYLPRRRSDETPTTSGRHGVISDAAAAQQSYAPHRQHRFRTARQRNSNDVDDDRSTRNARRPLGRVCDEGAARYDVAPASSRRLDARSLALPYRSVYRLD